MTIATSKSIHDAAARELCRIRGEDPDEIVRDENAHYDYAGICPRWMNARAEIRKHQEISEAISGREA